MGSEAPFERVLQAPETVLPPFAMIAGRSFLSDRVVRMPEACFVPRRRRPEMTSTLALDDAEQVRSGPSGRLRGLRRRFSPVRDLPGTVLVDLRWIGLRSWFQGLALAPPFALMLQAELRAAGIGPVTFLISERTPGKLATLLHDTLDDVVAHDGKVRGRFVSMTPQSLGVLDFLCASWVAGHAAPLLDRVERVDRDFPRKIFLDRKTRAIANGEDIAPLLAARGYETVFAEEFTAYEQIALLCRATHVAAIHGAALSPLVYRRPAHGPLHMVEIMSPGHVVPSFRDRVLGLDLTYFAVRGLPDARTARDAFDPALRPHDYARRHSRRSFRVDPLTIEIALDAESETDLYDYVWEDRSMRATRQGSLRHLRPNRRSGPTRRTGHATWTSKARVPGWRGAPGPATRASVLAGPLSLGRHLHDEILGAARAPHGPPHATRVPADFAHADMETA